MKLNRKAGRKRYRLNAEELALLMSPAWAYSLGIGDSII